MLWVFALSGSVLAMVELLGVVLACCLANVIWEENKERSRMEREQTVTRITAASNNSMKAVSENFDL